MSTYKPIDECRTVEELLSDPARWTQGCFAKSANNKPRRWYAEDACKFCLVGAMYRVYGETANAQIYDQLRDVTGIEVSIFNDDPSRTHAEVLEAVRKAGI